MDRLCKILGLSLIIAGVVFNEWVIQFLSQGQVKFAEIEKRVFLVTVEILLALLGFLILRYKKSALQNLLLVFISIFFTFGLLEIGLRFVPSNLEDDAPLWIPYEQKMINEQINERHRAKSKLNRHGFNDHDHPLRKPPGLTRIAAVLGDSFVWGAGVEENVIWTKKLARLLDQSGLKSEILNWGKSGWSTLHEFNFLKSEGIHYDFDLLLVDFVVNDPVMDDSQTKRFIYTGGIIDRVIVRPSSRIFPLAISFSVDLVNHFFDSYFGYGYVNWLNEVYSEENLKKYQALLKEMSEYCRERNIRMLFVMTPENHHPDLQKRFEKIIPLLENANIEYLNLYPAVYQELYHIPNRKLWANPADGHPGDMVTNVYAKYVYQYLVNQGYLNHSGQNR